MDKQTETKKNEFSEYEKFYLLWLSQMFLYALFISVGFAVWLS